MPINQPELFRNTSVQIMFQLMVDGVMDAGGLKSFLIIKSSLFDLFSDADFIDVCVIRLWAVLSSGWLCDSREKFVLVTGTIGY